jgi:hypothetical protein
MLRCAPSMYVRIFGTMSDAKIDAKSDNGQNLWQILVQHIFSTGPDGFPFADLLEVEEDQIESNLEGTLEGITRMWPLVVIAQAHWQEQAAIDDAL